MKRRDFLQASGLLAAGAVNAHAACRSPEAAESETRDRGSAGPAARRVLVTSAHSELARTIAERLKGDYQVRMTAPVHVETPLVFHQCALGHDESTKMVVRGADAIVHVAEAAEDTDQTGEIDYRTRCTYNLLQAAADEGVRAAVYLSSLRMMEGYDERFQVDEDWQPLPVPDSGALPHYLGEFTCREFARPGKLQVVVLRVGSVVSAEASGEQLSQAAWVDPRDVAQAVSCALQKLLADSPAIGGNWSVFHVLSRADSARIPIRKARRVLGYRPEFGGHQS